MDDRTKKLIKRSIESIVFGVPIVTFSIFGINSCNINDKEYINTYNPEVKVYNEGEGEQTSKTDAELTEIGATLKYLGVREWNQKKAN